MNWLRAATLCAEKYFHLRLTLQMNPITIFYWFYDKNDEWHCILVLVKVFFLDCQKCFLIYGKIDPSGFHPYTLRSRQLENASKSIWHWQTFSSSFSPYTHLLKAACSVFEKPVIHGWQAAAFLDSTWICSSNIIVAGFKYGGLRTQSRGKQWPHPTNHSQPSFLMLRCARWSTYTRGIFDYCQCGIWDWRYQGLKRYELREKRVKGEKNQLGDSSWRLGRSNWRTCEAVTRRFLGRQGHQGDRKSVV